MCDRCWVGAVVAAHDRDVEPCSPQVQLLDGGGSKRVARGQHRTAAVGLHTVGQFGRRGGLAGAVYADQRNHCQPVALGQVGGALAETGNNFRLGDFQHAAGLAAARLVRFADDIDDALGDGEAHVGGEQRGFEFLDVIAGEFGRAGDNPVDLSGQLGLRLFQTGKELAEQTHVIKPARLRWSGGGGVSSRQGYRTARKLFQ